MAKDFVTTPASFKSPNKSYRGGPGVYDGEKGLPPRTKTPNGVPEKIYDGNVKGPAKKDIVSY